jgi:predicted dehydrogenase
MTTMNEQETTSVPPVRWGVLGASHFALMAALPATRQAPLVDLRALASRSLVKARQAAASAGVPRAYGSYEELLADPEIEAVYNPLPNNLHVPWSIKAARAGKHVLCEKPIAMTAAEAEELAEVQQQTGKIIAEAFMIRYHPQWDKVVDLIRGGRIGEVRAVQVAFSYSNSDVANIRNQKDAGGGALLDVGCYAINVARLVFSAEPRRVASVCERDPQSGCDRLTSAILDFGGGQATFVVGTQHVRHQGVHVFGTQGHIDVEIPFNAPHDRPCKVSVDEGLAATPDFTVAQTSAEMAELLALPAANHYTAQWQAFSAAVRGGAPVRNDMRSAVANMRVIDAIFRAAESQRWEAV